MQKAQTLDDEYNLHKTTLISLSKAELEGQQIGSRKTHIKTMIEILQKKNIPPKQIRKILYKDLDGWVTDRFIRMVCVEMEVEVEEKPEVLPVSDSSAFFKNVEPSKPYAEQRNQLIKFNYDIIQEAKENIDELLIDEVHTIIKFNDQENDMKKGDEVLETRNWAAFFESPDLATEFFDLIKNMFYNEKDDWHKSRDERYSLLPKMRLPIFAFKTLVMNKHFCNRYYAHIKRATSITTKKLAQFINDVDSFSDLIHYVKEDAWKWNFIDIKCPTCKTNSLRVRISEDGTWNFICKNWEVHNTEQIFPATLFTSRLRQLTSKSSNAGKKYLSDKGITTPREQ